MWRIIKFTAEKESPAWYVKADKKEKKPAAPEIETKVEKEEKIVLPEPKKEEHRKEEPQPRKHEKPIGRPGFFKKFFGRKGD